VSQVTSVLGSTWVLWIPNCYAYIIIRPAAGSSVSKTICRQYVCDNQGADITEVAVWGLRPGWGMF